MDSIGSLSQKQLEDALIGLGEKPFRARQILFWVYKKYAGSFEEMTDLPAALREELPFCFQLSSLDFVGKQEGEGGWSKKYLWGEKGHPLVESVLLKYRYGLTGCVSTQVGCPVGCRFCASGLLKHERNLRTEEIVDQVLGMSRDEGKRIGRLVFMGTGEPFLNYKNVLGAINILCDEKAYGLSRRKITVSTVGIPDKIRDFAEDSLGVRLAISLHAASNEKRSRIVPLNDVYPVGEILSAARGYAEKTGQRLTFEYMLLGGFNDQQEDAANLAKVLKGFDCLVNLIPWNWVPGFKWEKPSKENVEKFKAVLQLHGMKVTERRSLGEAISGACGQLKRDVFADPS